MAILVGGLTLLSGLIVGFGFLEPVASVQGLVIIGVGLWVLGLARMLQAAMLG